MSLNVFGDNPNIWLVGCKVYAMEPGNDNGRERLAEDDQQ
jgi:hypothetical protein